jgi:pilus assembly protein CpaB
VASTGEGAAGRTRVVVEDAEVLAVDAIAADTGYPSPGSATVILRASSEDALRITAALNFARDVRLLLRPAGDVDPVLPPTTPGTP